MCCTLPWSSCDSCGHGDRMSWIACIAHAVLEAKQKSLVRSMREIPQFLCKSEHMRKGSQNSQRLLLLGLNATWAGAILKHYFLNKVLFSWEHKEICKVHACVLQFSLIVLRSLRRREGWDDEIPSSIYTGYLRVDILQSLKLWIADARICQTLLQKENGNGAAIWHVFESSNLTDIHLRLKRVRELVGVDRTSKQPMSSCTWRHLCWRVRRAPDLHRCLIAHYLRGIVDPLALFGC